MGRASSPPVREAGLREAESPDVEWIAGCPASARVLVVDDDAVMRELLGMLLTLKGHEVESCSSAIEALALLEPGDFDVVLTDFHMPGVSGAGLAENLLAARQPSLLVIGMSGTVPEPELIPLFDAFLHKPFQSEDFDEAVRLAELKAAARNGSAPTAILGAADKYGKTGADGTPILSESTFGQLAAMLPAGQLRELYRITLDDVGTRHARIAAHVAGGDLHAVHREAHAVKGSCGMVGALELQMLATAIEGSSDLDTVSIAEIPAACLRLRRMLDARLKD